MKYQWHFAALSLLFAASAWAETGTALKNDTLRTSPYSDAASAGTLSRGSSVDILAKKGAWLQIKSGGKTGWVRLLSVKRGAASGSSGAADVLALASGRAGTGQVVSTTGVRGLSEEDLKSAKFSESEIKKLETHTLSAEDAKKFAAAGGLHASKIDYLPAPKD
jgi:hypothetical protein